LCIAGSFGVQHVDWQIELLRKLESPLFPDGCWADDDDPTLSLSPKLTEDDSCLDGLTETDFIRKYDALRQWRLQREQCRFDLVRIQVNRGIEKRCR